MLTSRGDQLGRQTSTLSNPTASSKKRLNKLYRSRSNTDSDLQNIPQGVDVIDPTSSVPVGVKNRLYDLFGAIEKEFETLYIENINLRSKVQELTLKLAEGGNIPPEKAAELLEIEIGTSKAVKKGSQVGQKIKTALRVPPGRLVSSFKAGVAGVSVGGDTSRVRYVRSFLAHRDGIWDVDVCHSLPAVLGSASADQSASIWCIETGTCLLTYTGHRGSVNSIRFQRNPSLNDLLVLTASGDSSAHVWKASVSLPPQQNSTPFPMNSSEDELEPIASERDDSAVEDMNDHSNVVRSPLIELTGHQGVVIAADWLCTGNQVITASWDRTANIYDTERGEILHVLSGHDQELTHTCAHNNQKLVVTASKDTTFRLWDFREPIHSVAVFQGHTESVTSAVFSTTDKVISGSDDKTVRVWDLKNMRSPLATIRLDSPVNRLSVSPTHHVIAIPHDNRHIRLYDLSGNRLGRLPRSNRRSHRRLVCSTAWCDENPSCNLFTGGFDKMVLGWKVTFPLNKE